MENNDAARREAERLAAAALAAASFAAKNLSRRLAADARDRDMRDRDMRDRDVRDRDTRDRGVYDRDGRGRGGFGGNLGGGLGGLADDLGMLAGLAGRMFGADDDRRRGSTRPAAAAHGPAPQADRRHHIATGSDECCICPVCRMISAVRDPSPEFSERIASGASDLAAGVTTVLRAFGNATRRRTSAPEATGVVDAEVTRPETTAWPEAESGWDNVSDEDEIEILDLDIETDSFDIPTSPEAHAPSDMATPRAAEADEAEPAAPWGGSSFNSVWQAATRAGTTKPSHNGAPAPAKKAAAHQGSAADVPATEAPAPKAKAAAKKAVAKKAVAKKAVAKKATSDQAVTDAPVAKKSGDSGPAATAPGEPGADRTAAKKTTPTPAVAKKAVAKKAVAKKAVAKKAVAKKAPPSKASPDGPAAKKAGPADRS